MIELKPCPFCGGEASISQGYRGIPSVIADYVECIDCAAMTEMDFDEKMAVEKWNKRVEVNK